MASPTARPARPATQNAPCRPDSDATCRIALREPALGPAGDRGSRPGRRGRWRRPLSRVAPLSRASPEHVAELRAKRDEIERSCEH
jgi:hypothetical protein